MKDSRDEHVKKIEMRVVDEEEEGRSSDGKTS